MRSYIGILSMVIVYTLMYIVSKVIHSAPFEGVDALALLLPWVLVGAMGALWLRASRQRYALNVSQSRAPRCEANPAAIELEIGKQN